MAYEFAPGHSIGIAGNAVLQYFRARGLANFCGFTRNGVAAGNQIACPADPAQAVDGLTDQGYDLSHGFSFRIGYLGQVTDWLRVGAYYQSRSWMTRFERYENLFAEQGDFDIPEHFGAGIALTPRQGTLIAVDVQHIRYASVASVGNLNTGFTAPAAFGLGPALGDDDGPGFAWRDMTVLKLGIEQQVHGRLELRAGYSYGRQPIPADQTAFNVVAPGVIEHHATLGLAWQATKRFDVQAFYMHGFGSRVEGTSPGNVFSAGHGNLHMNQNSFGVTLGLNF